MYVLIFPWYSNLLAFSCAGLVVCDFTRCFLFYGDILIVDWFTVITVLVIVVVVIITNTTELFICIIVVDVDKFVILANIHPFICDP